MTTPATREPALPAVMRVEAKFTTSKGIVVPRRELDALSGNGADAVGLVAVLFWCGERDLDGRWILVDAAESFRRGDAEGASLGAACLRRLRNSQPWLGAVHGHVERSWKPFLAAFGELALAGHEVLKAELEEIHRADRFAEHLPAGDVLDLEHRARVAAIVGALGEHVAGHVFQDLLAYLLGLAGYRTVQVNPVGVPDIEVADLAARHAPSGDAQPDETSLFAPRIHLELSRPEVERLRRLASAAGDTDLLRKLLALPDFGHAD